MGTRRPFELTPPATLHMNIVRTKRQRTTSSTTEKTDPTKQKRKPAASTGPHRGQEPLLFAILLGFSGATLRRHCDVLMRTARRRGAQPMFLIDDDASFANLRDLGASFEYIPSPQARRLAPPSLQWDLYRRRRAQLLYEKWQPAAIISVGRAAEDFAKLMPNPPQRREHPSGTKTFLRRLFPRSQ